MMCKLSERCIRTNKNEYCYKCLCNTEVIVPKNYFMGYRPVCPLGYTDCVWDPGYIYYHYPDWYEELFGDTVPTEAVSDACKPSCDICCNYNNEDK